jgi:hypothetical protein
MMINLPQKAQQTIQCPKCGDAVGLTYLARHMENCKGKGMEKAIKH